MEVVDGELAAIVFEEVKPDSVMLLGNFLPFGVSVEDTQRFLLNE